MKNVSLVLIFFFGLKIFAAGAIGINQKRHPNQSLDSDIHLKIVYGEKTTLFDIIKGNGGFKIRYSNPNESSQVKELSKEDLIFLSTKLAAVPSPGNQKEFCPRNFVEVRTDARKIIGCLGSPNKVARDLQELANLLSLLF